MLAHIRNLDYDSAFVAEVRGGQEFRGWDAGRYLTVAQIDAIRILQYILVLIHKDPKKRKPEPPEPTTTPDKKAKKQRQDKPGSFSFIARSIAARTRKRKEGRG